MSGVRARRSGEGHFDSFWLRLGLAFTKATAAAAVATTAAVAKTAAGATTTKTTTITTTKTRRQVESGGLDLRVS